MIVFNVFDCRDIILKSPLFMRFTEAFMTETDPRISIWIAEINNMWYYPLGGPKLRQLSVNNYAHNIWLDIIQNAGVFMGFAFLYYTIYSFNNLYLLYKNKSISNIKKFILIAIVLSIYINCSIEAILDGNFILILILFATDGIINRILYQTDFANKLTKNWTRGMYNEMFMVV